MKNKRENLENRCPNSSLHLPPLSSSHAHQPVTTTARRTNGVFSSSNLFHGVPTSSSSSPSSELLFSGEALGRCATRTRCSDDRNQRTCSTAFRHLLLLPPANFSSPARLHGSALHEFAAVTTETSGVHPLVGSVYCVPTCCVF